VTFLSAIFWMLKELSALAVVPISKLAVLAQIMMTKTPQWAFKWIQAYFIA
jgi:hypothetical protein